MKTKYKKRENEKKQMTKHMGNVKNKRDYGMNDDGEIEIMAVSS